MQFLQLGLAKLSMLFFYRRIFCITDRWNWIGVSTSMVICVTLLWTLAGFFTTIFQCGKHVDWFWTNDVFLCWVEDGSLTGSISKTMNYAFQFSDFGIDALIFLIPLYSVGLAAPLDI